MANESLSLSELKIVLPELDTRYTEINELDYMWRDDILLSDIYLDNGERTSFIEYKWQQWAQDPYLWMVEQCFTKDESNDTTYRRFPNKEYLKTLMILYWLYGPVLLNKSRRMLATHMASLIQLWALFFQRGSANIIVSKDYEAAKFVIQERVKEVYDKLDPRIPYPKLRNGKEILVDKIVNPYNANSTIKGFSSTASGARGLTGTNIFLDEFAYHYSQRELLASILPALQGARCRLLVGSTPDFATYFVDLVRDIGSNAQFTSIIKGLTTVRNKQNFLVVDLDYKADPDKTTKEWYYRERYGTTIEGDPIPGAIAKDKDWEREYERSLTSVDGTPCFPEFRKDLHTSCYPKVAQLDSVRMAILELSFDFGELHPAVCFAQKDSLNRLVVHGGMMGYRERLQLFLVRVGSYILEHFSHCKKDGKWNIRLHADIAGNRPNGQGTAEPAFQILLDFFREHFGYTGEVHASYTSPKTRVRVVRDLLSTTVYDTQMIIFHPMAGDFTNLVGETRTGVIIDMMAAGYRYKDNREGAPEQDEPYKDGYHDHFADTVTNLACSLYPIAQQIENEYNGKQSNPLQPKAKGGLQGSRASRGKRRR